MSKKSEKLADWLGQGGQKQMRRGGAAQIIDVSGPERKRATAAGYHAAVTGILDPRMDLTAQERAIGNCYGAYFEQANTGGSSEFLREFVDGGGAGGGGYSERQAHIVAMVCEAQAALEKMPAVRYPRPKARKGTATKKATKAGRYLPIWPLTLIDAVCVHGHSIEAVAIRFQWFMLEKQSPRQTWKESKLITQWRPRKHIVEGIRLALNQIGDAWAEAGMNVPSSFGTIDVE